MPRIGPLDQSSYRQCCGQAPRFTKDANIWFALCIMCGMVASAMDGSADGLAGAWNEAMRQKDGDQK